MGISTLWGFDISYRPVITNNQVVEHTVEISVFLSKGLHISITIEMEQIDTTGLYYVNFPF